MECIESRVSRMYCSPGKIRRGIVIPATPQCLLPQTGSLRLPTRPLFSLCLAVAILYLTYVLPLCELRTWTVLPLSHWLATLLLIHGPKRQTARALS
jgi:hypothetical protein